MMGKKGFTAPGASGPCVFTNPAREKSGMDERSWITI
jgi:hypothetical protein